MDSSATSSYSLPLFANSNAISNAMVVRGGSSIHWFMQQVGSGYSVTVLAKPIYSCKTILALVSSYTKFQSVSTYTLLLVTYGPIISHPTIVPLQQTQTVMLLYFQDVA